MMTGPALPNGDFDAFLASGEFVRELDEHEDEASRLRRAVELTVELVDGCDHAGISIFERGRVRTAANTDDIALRADELQHALNEGPGLEAVRAQTTVISPDVANELRWPHWAPRVHEELGVGSLSSLLLYTHKRSFGALNLYADRRFGLDTESILLAHTLSAHIAVAMAASREITNRGIAMVNRTVIGQAEGILMERLDISADQAFAYLRRVSQDTNQKLAVVAADLVRTRNLPHLALMETIRAEADGNSNGKGADGARPDRPGLDGARLEGSAPPASAAADQPVPGPADEPHINQG